MKNSFFLLLGISGIFFFGFLINSCQKDTKTEKVATFKSNEFTVANRNSYPGEFGEVPEATVKLLQYKNESGANSRESCSSLTPALLEATLSPGESISEEKTAIICSTIEKGDVIFMFDLTGSMGKELENVKANSINIMGAIREVMGEANFGVVSHMDYDGVYSGCGYTDHYGSFPYYGDYPYKLNQSIVSDEITVATSINNLRIGYGWDYPESYTRVLYELTAPDAGIGWRQGTKKIIVAWLDNQPHDCELVTGPDPGRDAIANNSDDVAINDALLGLIDNNIVLFVLYSGQINSLENHFDLWKGYCLQTGGDAFQINPDGTIPDGTDIDEFIASIIQENCSPLNQVNLQVCTPGFENWLTNVVPENYTNVEIEESVTLPFTIEITVPEGTENGVYEFDICLIGDGVEFGRQHVKINVLGGNYEVPFDIHPTSCPNPINRKSGGLMPAAIVGFDGFNVRDVDVQSLNIQGVHPIRSAIDDVVTPYFPFTGKELNKMSCTTDGADGYDDLTLKFDNKEIAILLKDFKKDDIVLLKIEGKLNDGAPIIGEDIIIIVK